jgi:hypothetical protein
LYYLLCIKCHVRNNICSIGAADRAMPTEGRMWPPYQPYQGWQPGGQCNNYKIYIIVKCNNKNNILILYVDRLLWA